MPTRSSFFLPAILLLEILTPACQQTKTPPASPSANLPQTVIPYSEVLSYHELTREERQRRLTDDSPYDKRIKLALQLRMESINIKGATFQTAVNLVRDSIYVNIYVDWTALQEAGVDKNTPVTLNLQNARYERILDDLLNQIPPAKLGYIIDDGVITISTREELESPRYCEVYVFDIRDMLVTPDRNLRPPGGLGLHPITPEEEKNSTAKDQTAVTSDLFNPQEPSVDDKISAEIIEYIKTTIAPSTWLDKGGKVGKIRELNGQLIINQTLENQRAIYRLLEQLKTSDAWKARFAEMKKNPNPK